MTRPRPPEGGSVSTGTGDRTGAARLRVVFVDDEPQVLDGIRRGLHHLRDRWECRFLTSCPEALELLEGWPADAVVADLKLPGMNGAAFIRRVQDRHPRARRLVLSGEAGTRREFQTAGCVHRFLTKPVAATELEEAIRLSLAMDRHLADPALRERCARLGPPPRMPDLYRRLLDVLQAERLDLDRVAAVIARDVAMAGRLLQVVNSPFYGLARRITELPQAVGILGLGAVRSLVLTAKAFDLFHLKGFPHLDLPGLQDHSLLVGALARHIARLEGWSEHGQETAFLAGLLHDIGKLVLIADAPERYDRLLVGRSSRADSLVEGEREAFGLDHPTAGAHLLRTWSLPDEVLQAVAFHHRPRAVPAAGPRSYLPLVHVADAFAHRLRPSQRIGGTVDRGYLEEQGLLPRLASWYDHLRQVLDGR